MRGPKIIGLGHRKRVGKNQLGNYLVELGPEYGFKYSFTVSFASALKQKASELFGWAGMQDENYYERNPELRSIVLPKVGKTPRQIMIEFGMKLREIHPDIWLNLTMDEICKQNSKVGDGVLAVITDVRFPNEAEKVKSLGGLVIKVVRPDIPDTDDAADSALKCYEGWSGIVDNGGSLDDLKASARKILEALETET